VATASVRRPVASRDLGRVRHAYGLVGRGEGFLVIGAAEVGLGLPVVVNAYMYLHVRIEGWVPWRRRGWSDQLITSRRETATTCYLTWGIPGVAGNRAHDR
jgi:hypothetical protein